MRIKLFYVFLCSFYQNEYFEIVNILNHTQYIRVLLSTTTRRNKSSGPIEKTRGTLRKIVRRLTYDDAWSRVYIYIYIFITDVVKRQLRGGNFCRVFARNNARRVPPTPSPDRQSARPEFLLQYSRNIVVLYEFRNA